MPSESEDLEIQARLLAVDSSALDMIWKHYSSDLLGYLASILGSHHDAEDALQEVFVRISKKRESVAKARLLKPYLFRLARNVGLNLIKKNRRAQDRERAASDWLELNEEVKRRDERTHQLGAVLRVLTEKQPSVIVLKFYRDKTFGEIGEMLGISENTAASRYRYGMAKLEPLMQEVS